MTSPVKERPILFSGEMVRAILDGRKTQTRRVARPQPDPRCTEAFKGADGVWRFSYPTPSAPVSHADWDVQCLYGVPGDRLWVRETFCMAEKIMSLVKTPCYRATEGDINPSLKWTPAIHMPRTVSRITLEVTGVRVERLQDISEADAIAEGCPGIAQPPILTGGVGYLSLSPVVEYAELWNKINGAGGWEKNPWVWVIEFKRVQP